MSGPAFGWTSPGRLRSSPMIRGSWCTWCGEMSIQRRRSTRQEGGRLAGGCAKLGGDDSGRGAMPSLIPVSGPHARVREPVEVDLVALGDLLELWPQDDGVDVQAHRDRLDAVFGV